MWSRLLLDWSSSQALKQAIHAVHRQSTPPQRLLFLPARNPETSLPNQEKERKILISLSLCRCVQRVPLDSREKTIKDRCPSLRDSHKLSLRPIFLSACSPPRLMCSMCITSAKVTQERISVRKFIRMAKVRYTDFLCHQPRAPKDRRARALSGESMRTCVLGTQGKPGIRILRPFS